LSKLEPSLNSVGVPLYAVLHETLGSEEFKQFFTGQDIFLDTEKHFYGPQERRMLIMGFLRLDTWINGFRSWQDAQAGSGTQGNLKGDGTLLGGVFVLGTGDQGILYEHREGTFGDNVNTTDLMEAVQKIKPVE